MNSDPVERVSGLGPKLVPTAFALLLAVLSVVPTGIPGYALVTPNLLLIAVYHWTIYRPEHLPTVAIFLIGLMLDLLTDGPPGITPLALLLLRAVLYRQRRLFVGKSFPVTWWGFVLATLGVSAVSWAAASLLTGKFEDLPSAAFQAVLTIAFYPPLAWLFTRAQRVTAG